MSRCRICVVSSVLAVAVAACASTESAKAANGEVAGIVLAAPACPVEQAGSPCPPRPSAATLVQAKQGDQVRARETTGDDGRFRLRVAEGSYDIVATNSLGSTAQVHVDVVAGHTRNVTLTVDSGIR